MIVYCISINLLKDRVVWGGGLNESAPLNVQVINYYKEADGYKISVNVENTSENIICLNKMKLEIVGQMGRSVYLESIRANNEFKFGIDQGEIVEYYFILPEGITFDKNKFIGIQISYECDLYKFRMGNNSLFIKKGSLSYTNSLKSEDVSIIGGLNMN